MRTVTRRPFWPIASISFAALLLTCFCWWQTAAAFQTEPLVNVSAASYQTESIAPETIVAAFGNGLATQTAQAPDADPTANGQRLPTTLAGTTVLVNGQAAGLIFVSPGQVNYLLPASTQLGPATVEITNSEGKRFAGTIEVRQVAPAIFTANANGTGVPAANALRLKTDGQLIYENITIRNVQTNTLVAAPINLGPEGERVFLVLYLSGIRRAPDPNGDGNVNEFVRVILNGLEIAPTYAGPQGSLFGLDQINVEIPRSLLGSLTLDITVVVNGFGLSNSTRAELTAPAITSLNWVPLGLATRTIRTFTTLGSTLYAATNQGVWGSTDNGANWFSLNNGLPADASILTLLTNGTTLYAGLAGTGGVCISTNGGQSWTAINNGLSGSTLTINNLVFFGGRLYAATAGGVCVYLNGAWQALNTGLTATDTLTLLVYNGQLCVGTRGGGIFLLGGNNQWTSISNGLPPGAEVLTIVSAGGLDAAVFAGLSNGGLCISRNGGQSWTQVAGGLPINISIYSIWLDGLRLYVGTSLGTYVSNDGGVTWTLLINGLGSCAGAKISYAVKALAGRLLLGSNGCGVYGAAIITSTTNRPPVSYSQTIITDEDTPRFIGLSAFDPDLDPLAYAIQTNPANGSLSGTINSLVYTPRLNFNGNDRFTFFVSDGRGGVSSVAEISLIVNPVNDPPVLTVPDTLNVSIGQAISFTVTASDVDSAKLGLSAANLPQGASFTPATGAFAWTPNAAGTFIISFSVSDGLAVTTRTVTINVGTGNRAPVLTVPGTQTVTAGQPLSFTVSATDPDTEQTLTFTAANVPNGAVFTPNTRQFNWTPALNQLGTFSVTFAVTDNGTPPLSTSRTVTIVVNTANRAPVLTVPATQTVTLGQTVSFSVSATDADTDQTLTFAAFGLPSGATFNAATRQFTWTPTANQLGSVILTFSVTDNGFPPLSDNKNVTIIVNTTNRAPVLTVPGTQTITVGQSVSFGVSATDPDTEQTLSFSVTNLPSGATFNANTRQFSWTPAANQVGSITMLFTVTDNGLPPLSDSRTVTIIVNSNNRAPVLTVPGTQTVALGQTVSFSISATDADAGQSLTYAAFGLPLGATFNATTRQFTWTPGANQVGNFVVSFSATDNGIPPLSDSKTVLITVSSPNRAPVLTVPTARSATVGQLVSFQVSAVDLDPGQSLTFQVTNAPTGSTFNSTTGQFSWTPSANQTGTFTLSFTVSDNGTPPLSDTKTVTITVTGATGSGSLTWTKISTGLPSGVDPKSVAGAGDAIFVSYQTTYGVYRSINGGTSWSEFTTGLPSKNAYGLVIVGDNVFVGCDGGVYRTTRFGTSWTAANNGISIVNSAAGKGVFTLHASGSTLYAGTFNGLIYRSTDNGANWTSISSGLPTGSGPLVVTSFLATNSTLYAGFIVNGLYRSTDNGATWNPVSGGLPASSFIIGLAQNGSSVFAALLTERGVYRSADNGATWTQTSNGLPTGTGGFVESLTAAGGNLYVGFLFQGVSSSSDNGATWAPNRTGLPSQTVALALATDSTFIYLGAGANTGGGSGVYRARLPQAVGEQQSGSGLQ